MNVQTSIAIGWMGVPSRKRGFVTFLLIFFLDIFSPSRTGQTERRKNMHDN
jgi:hypothetical protein